ncbi:MAG: hypothetical protein KI786_10395 [Mameliella sp.]|nr:hypothetical protein [Phaeodactylibacter sp.]
MYKVAFISLFCLLAVVPAFQLSIIYGFYSLNKAQITRDHCVNIEKPELMCSGKCYINDIIAEASAHDGTQAPLPAVEDLQPITSFFHKSLGFAIPDARLTRQFMPIGFLGAILQRLYATSVFKPPRF